MTPEQINIAIAEACGWKPHYSMDGFGEHPVYAPHHMQRLPNYTTDLNAMHEAEKSEAVCRKLFDYCTLLQSITGGELFFHATAAQRAEAFLKTIGKWIECCCPPTGTDEACPVCTRCAGTK